MSPEVAEPPVAETKVDDVTLDLGAPEEDLLKVANESQVAVVAPEAVVETPEKAEPIILTEPEAVVQKTGFLHNMLNSLKQKWENRQQAKIGESYRSENVQVTTRSADMAIDHNLRRRSLSPEQQARVAQARQAIEQKNALVAKVELDYADKIKVAEKHKTDKVFASIAKLEGDIASGKYGSGAEVRAVISGVLAQQRVVQENYRSAIARYEMPNHAPQEIASKEMAARYVDMKGILKAEELYIAYLTELLDDPAQFAQAAAAPKVAPIPEPESLADQRFMKGTPETVKPYRPFDE